MRALFDIIGECEDGLRDASWNEQLSAEVVDSLRQLGLLESCERSRVYPCGREGGCWREIHPYLKATPGPRTFIARCAHPPTDPDDTEACYGVEVTERDLESSRFRRDVFLGQLQRLLGLSGARPITHLELKQTYLLGRKGWCGLDRPVFFSWDTKYDALADFLLWHQMNDGPALLLVAVGDHFDGRKRDRHKPNDTVAVVGLDRLLAFEGGQLGLTSWARSQLSAFSLVKAGTVDETRCWALENGIPDHPIGRQAYEELVRRAEREEFDLYLDLTSTAAKGNRWCGRRLLGGGFERIELPAVPASVLGQVIRAPGGLTPKEFHGKPARVGQTFHEARKHLDQRVEHLPKRPYQCFQARTGGLGRESTYLFQPPEGFRYLLLHNLPVETRKHALAAT